MLRALLERDIVPDVVIGTLGRRVERGGHRGRPDARGGRAARGRSGSRCAATWSSRAAACARAWNLLTRDDHLFSDEGLRAVIELGRHPGDRSRTSRCRSGWWRPTSTPATRSCSRAARCARRCWPAPRSRGSSRRSATTAALLVDGAVVDTVPLSHALAGPVDRIYVLNVSAT